MVVRSMFQFPSNGKDILNALAAFKQSVVFYEFQFPSNGKDILNTDAVAEAKAEAKVSIPFKRERHSERYCKRFDP